MKEFMSTKFKPAMIWFFKSFIWLGLILFIADIVTKNVIVANRSYILSQPGSHLVLIENFLAIGYTINKNAAFGIGLGSDLANRIAYIVLAVIATGIIMFVYVKKYSKLGKFVKACLMMMVVGALGNMVDRIFYTGEYLGTGYNGVVDWIDFYGIWKYVFNLADSAIVVGTIMLIIWLIVDEVKTSKSQKVQLAKETKNEEQVAQNITTEVVEENHIETANSSSETDGVKEEEAPSIQKKSGSKKANTKSVNSKSKKESK